MLKRWPAVLIQDGRTQEVEDWVAEEESYELYLDDTMVDTMVVSPSDLEAHAVGFLVTEGLLEPERIEEVRCEGRRVFVRTAEGKGIPPSKTLWRSSAYRGWEGGSIPVVSSKVTVDPALIVGCAQQISEHAENWQKSGGTHISLLFDQKGGLIKAAEDIGRHNTVDKVIGYALLRHISLTETILVCSGRQPEGMVLKAARARVPIVVTKAAVTNRGIETAERLGVTLIGFARGVRFVIYAHPARVQVASDRAVL